MHDELSQKMHAMHIELSQKMNATHDELSRQMRGQYVELSHQMHVLHEDVIDRIKATNNADAPSRSEWREWLAELRDENSRRIEPLEAAAKYLLGRQ